MEKYKKLALAEAEASKCKKRKVGAIIVNKSDGLIVSSGHNFNSSMDGSEECEDTNGNTKAMVTHAEVAALDNLPNNYILQAKDDFTMYVTHKPCDICAKAIKAAGIKEVIIVQDFMKFDSGKLRYSLIPPIFTKALASVLTYGAKKYKPNNWQQVDDVDRYWDALYRHLEAHRSGEMFDSESKLPHLWHALTNVGFILFLDNKTQSNSVQNDLSND